MGMRVVALSVAIGLASSLVPTVGYASSSSSADDASLDADSTLARQAPTSSLSVAPVPDVLPGEIVVDFVDDLPDADIANMAYSLGISLSDNSPEVKGDGNVAVGAVAGARLSEIVARLSSDGRVEAVEPMIVARALFQPNDPKYAEQWHMKRAGAERAWDYACGEGVTVAVVDTGIACYDEGGFMRGTDLLGASCVPGYNFVGKNTLAADDQGHGTHVAGTIAQATHNGIGVAGLAHCAKLMPVKVLSKQGWGTMADVAEGIRWAADHGARVINLSLGSSMKSKVVEKAVVYAHKRGAVVVAAAGNSGKSVGYPAGYADAIAVSATDRNDNIAWFSSRGPEIAIGAPGVAVTQQTVCEAGKNKCEQWGVFNGTSMASPHVAAAAALLVGEGVTNPEAVRAVLQTTASPKDDKLLFGAGILDAGAAVARTHALHLAVRAALAMLLFAAVAYRIRKRQGTPARDSFVLFGILAAGTGLLPFLPWLGVLPRAGTFRWMLELAMRPFGQWDLILVPSLHKWLLLASAIPTFLLTAFFFQSPRLRRFTGGFAVGAAALAVQLALSGETFFALGRTMGGVYAFVNAAACLWVARFALDKGAR